MPRNEFDRALRAINGDPSDLSMDRATAELRRGRVILIDGNVPTLAAQPDASPNCLTTALQTLAGARPKLVLTRHRLAALGGKPNGADAVSLNVPDDADADWLDRMAHRPAHGVEAAPLPSAHHIAPATAPERAALTLARLAQLLPVAVTAPVASEVAAGIRQRTATGDLISVAAAAVLSNARTAPANVRQVGAAAVPLADDVDCRFVVFRTDDGAPDHVAVLVGTPETDDRAALVRLHSACLTGDLFGSLRCDCGEQLRSAIRALVSEGGGVLIYLAQEGRGIGLANKMRAYDLQDTGYDTVDADQILGFGADERGYDTAAAILRALGINRIRLMTNNPDKVDALRTEGVAVTERVPLVATVTDQNRRYLTAKAQRAGHLLDLSQMPDDRAAGD